MAVARLQRLSSVDVCAITRLLSTTPPPQRPSRGSICVQIPKSDDKPPPAKSARMVQPGIEANRSCSGVEFSWPTAASSLVPTMDKPTARGAV